MNELCLVRSVSVTVTSLPVTMTVGADAVAGATVELDRVRGRGDELIPGAGHGAADGGAVSLGADLLERLGAQVIAADRRPTPTSRSAGRGVHVACGWVHVPATLAK